MKSSKRDTRRNEKCFNKLRNTGKVIFMTFYKHIKVAFYNMPAFKAFKACLN